MDPLTLAAALVAAAPLPSGPACPSCTLELRHVTRLGADHRLALVDPSFVFLRDGRGHYLVGDGHYVTELLEFDPAGRFVAVRAGGGPGAFEGVRALYRWRADSVLALDQAMGRLVVLTPDLGVARSTPFPEPSIGDPAMLSDGRLLVWELGREGNRVRIVPVDGEPGLTIDSLPALLGVAPRLLAPASEGGFWLGRMDRFDFELRRADGSVARRVTRAAPWMEGADGPIGLPTTIRPNPRIVALQDDGEHLWVFGFVAAPGWAPTATSAEPLDGSGLPSATELTQLFDTIVEVLDRSTGELVASTRLSGAYLATEEPGWATRAVRAAAGRSAIEVVRLGLTIP
jgi:hypothetical protein